MNKIFITLFLLGNSLLAQDISLDEKFKNLILAKHLDYQPSFLGLDKFIINNIGKYL